MQIQDLQHFLAQTPNNGTGPSQFTLPASDLRGENVLAFEQTYNDTYKWGFTNLLVEDVIV